MNKKMIGVAALFLAVASGQASNIAVTVGSYIVNFNKLTKTTVTLGIQPAAANASNVATIPVTMSTTRITPAGLQFDVAYIPADVSAISATVGASGTVAGKSVQCATTSPGVFRCLVVGVNSTTMAPGPVAVLSVTVARTTVIQLQAVSASTAGSQALSGAVSPSSAQISVSPPATVVQSVACAVPLYDSGLPPNTYNIEPGESVSCTITLNQAAGTGGFSASVSAGATGLVLPATVAIPQGQATATFQVVGQ